MTACQPTNLHQAYIVSCGSWLAGDGGLKADPALWDAPSPTIQASLLAKLLILPLLLLRLLTLILICCPFPRGRTQALRRGHRGKDAAVAAPGHGWPMAAGPRSRTGARACGAKARHRTKGANALWLLWRSSKVTRCKSETNRSRYRRNGSVHRHRQKALPIKNQGCTQYNS